MKASARKFETVDEYFSSFPSGTKKILKEMRKAIKQAAPQAEELISYNMPAFKFQGVLVYYAAYKEHIGFYPTASGIAKFKNELLSYEVSKGTARFSIKERIPFELIKKIVRFRVKENIERTELKKM